MKYLKLYSEQIKLCNESIKDFLKSKSNDQIDKYLSKLSNDEIIDKSFI
jgi:hypothetical protein